LLAARGGDNNSTMFRAYTWQGTAHMALARPLLGWGPGSFLRPTGNLPSPAPRATRIMCGCKSRQRMESVASLLLLGTCLVATARGWRALRGNHWPLAAGALAALWAFIAHGFTDYGWGTTSIALLLCLTLGCFKPWTPA
jgi:O-antigen ligase